MALWKINPQTLTDIADAIRYAEKSSGVIKVSDFERRIKALSGKPLPPTPIYRDLVVIPDKYNTGCKGELTPFALSMGDGLVWRDNTSYLDFNNGKCLRYISDNTTITFENIKFNTFRFVNFNQYSSSSAYYRTGIVFKFINCEFGSFDCNYTASVDKSAIDVQLENCTMGYFKMRGTLNNCKIGGLTSYFDTLPSDVGNDLANTYTGSELTNCYLYDLEYPTETQGSIHLDGLQEINTNGLILENCRFECPDMSYTSQGGWSYALYLETSANNITLKDNIYNGGGNYGLHIAEGENQVSENNIISRINVSAPYYNAHSGIGCRINDDLFVSSVWVEDGLLHSIVTNDTYDEKTLTIKVNSNQYTHTISAFPRTNRMSFADLPIDIDITTEVNTGDIITFYDGETLIRTYVA